MSRREKKVILNSVSGYSRKNDDLLRILLAEEVLLFCAVGRDCELWHDVMDELIVGDGSGRMRADMVTTWHPGETLDEVIEFARDFDLSVTESDAVRIITI